MKRLWIILGIAFVALGIGLTRYAGTLPVYVGNFSPIALASQLEAVPEPERGQQWLEQLAAHETSHKRVFDGGAGIFALGFALLIAAFPLGFYSRPENPRSVSEMLRWWAGAWILEVPGSFWILNARYMRDDFPPWGDSLGIPKFGEVVFSVMGWLLTTLVLVRFLRHRQLDAPGRLRKPKSVGEWCRTLALSFWLLFLLWFGLDVIRDGEVGTVMSCITGAAVLWIALTAPPALAKEAGHLKLPKAT